MQRLSMLAISWSLTACGHQAAGGQSGVDPDPGAGKPSLVVTSSAFAAGAAIPASFTCEGENVAPPLAWSGAPAGTQSYAVIVDDPDAPDPAAPKRTFVHWVLVNIPASVTSLEAGAAPPPGAMTGTNDFDHAAWNGPCPPIGRHRYMFKVYALDVPALGRAEMTKPQLLAAMAGHVLAKGELMGTYEKAKVTRP